MQKFRLRFNWQQGGQLCSGRFQRDRRLDFWTSVTRIQHPFQWGKLRFTPQYKFMLLRLEDRERQVRLRSELRSIPILRLEYALSPRTTLRAGVQGLGPLPYRHRDDTSERNSFEQRSSFLSLINTSPYFGYELVTIVGVSKDTQKVRHQIQGPTEPRDPGVFRARLDRLHRVRPAVLALGPGDPHSLEPAGLKQHSYQLRPCQNHRNIPPFVYGARSRRNCHQAESSDPGRLDLKKT